MSKKRQPAIFDPRRYPGAVISTLSYAYASGHIVPQHFHEQDQILYGTGGVMAVTTTEGMWVVPPHRAVWIPAKTIHSIAIWGNLTMKTLYIKPKLVKRLSRQCCVINVSPLLKELLLEACKLPALYRRVPVHSRLIAVILDHLEQSPFIPLQLPMPSDARAQRVAVLLLKARGDLRPLAELCVACGASKRTIERIFRQETGLSFGRWRQQLSLARAIQLLAEGKKVSSIAFEASYSSPSAFIAMFKSLVGATPTQYFEARPD